MKKIALTTEHREGFLFAIVLFTGTILMLLAGQLALRMPRTWQIHDANMDSKLNPNEAYALYRQDANFLLAPIRTDIPNLLATVSTAQPGSIIPPLAIEFKTPAQIVTTTPFQLGSTTPAAAETALSPMASATATVSPTSTEAPTPTVMPSPTPWPTSTRRPATRTATRTWPPPPTFTASPTHSATPVSPSTPTHTVSPTVTVTITPVPAVTVTDTHTPTPTHTQTQTQTYTPTPTDTATATATFTLTATSTDTVTPTPTDTVTPTPTATTSSLGTCVITGSNIYIIPPEGCTASFSTAAQGAIFSLNMVDSGNLSVQWFGLLGNQTSGMCTGQSSNLTRGNPLINIAVAKRTTTSMTINNSNHRAIAVHIFVFDWLVGGCR